MWIPVKGSRGEDQPLKNRESSKYGNDHGSAAISISAERFSKWKGFTDKCHIGYSTAFIRAMSIDASDYSSSPNEVSTDGR